MPSAAISARRRLFAVFDRQLKDNMFRAGAYSIADIATWSWVHAYKWSGVSVDGLPHLQRWLNVVAERPAVIRGRAVSEPVDFDREQNKEELIQHASKILV